MTTQHPSADHCGGCGWTHEHRALDDLGQLEDPMDAVRAVGRRSAHVGMVALGDRTVAVCAGTCCRDARESATRIAGERGLLYRGSHVSVWTMWIVVGTQEELDAMDAAEAESERLYASSYGLGL